MIDDYSTKPSSQITLIIIDSTEEEARFLRCRLNKLKLLFFVLVLGNRNQKFKEAVLQSNLTLLIDCLGLGVNPNIDVDDGNVALHIAAEKCDFPILQIMLNRPDIEVDKRNSVGITPLMVACLVNCREAVQLLLKRNADPNLENTNGNRPLHYACENKSMGIVFDLVAKGALVNFCTNVFDRTPLTIAVIERPSPAIAKFLLRKGAKFQGNRLCPLFLESALVCNNNDQLTMFKLLVYNGMNLHQLHPIENRNCLHYVAISGYAPLAEYLITLNMEPDLFIRDSTGRTPMDLTLDHGNFKIFYLFKFAYIKRHVQSQKQTKIHRKEPRYRQLRSETRSSNSDRKKRESNLEASIETKNSNFQARLDMKNSNLHHVHIENEISPSSSVSSSPPPPTPPSQPPPSPPPQ